MKKKAKAPNIVRGGIAIPLGNNYYYMSGRKHKDGGIDIGKNPRKGIEVEDGEVLHVGNKELKVFSAQPMINGNSPAGLIMNGANPNKVFNAQEQYKDRNKINDDGTKKKRMGGLSRNKYYRSKSKAGGLYSVTSNGETKLYQFPSMGNEIKAVMKTINKFKNGGRRKYEDGGDEKRFMPIAYASEIGQVPTEQDILNYFYPRTIPKLTISPFVYNTMGRLNANIENEVKRKEEERQKIRRRFTGERLEDLTGITSNIMGSLAAAKATNDTIDKFKYKAAPMPEQAVKLKTRINIAPQLDAMRESLARYEREVATNTSSSQTALDARNKARLADIQSRNTLYGDKESQETSLINQDRLNRQGVTNKNITTYNAWKQGKTDFENSIALQKMENQIGLINNINTGIQDYITRRQTRRKDNNTIMAAAIANPNLPIEIFEELGLVAPKNRRLYRKYNPIR